MKALVTESVSRSYGGLRAVDRVSLHIEPGERRALIGPNGAGKTTLFNLMGGQVKPTHGRIFLFEKEVTNLPPYQRARMGLARTFQITNLLVNLTVLENILLALHALDRSRLQFYRPLFQNRRLMERANRFLEEWGLEQYRDTRIRNLSYGDQRQIEIMMGLAGDPRLLLLDEPTAGLSPAETQMVVERIRSLDSDITILLIEHDMEVAFALANHIMVLHQGRIFAEGTPSDIRSDPDVMEIYLGTTAGEQPGA